MNSDFQAQLFKDIRLHFINAHLAAFEVEPLYPLEIFKGFIANVDGDCAIEASCKIESDKLLASRSVIGFFQGVEGRLAQIIDFFRQVESRADVKINDDLFQQFLGKTFDFSKVERITTGVDLRQNLADSSLKLHMRLEDYPEKIDAALALSDSDSAAQPWVALQTVDQIGFDFYFDGRSEIELYARLPQERFQQFDVQAVLKENFSPFVLQPLPASNVFHIGFSKANTDPVLYYQLKHKKDLLSYFAINDTAKRVQAFYQHQAVLFLMVGVTENELQNSRIENIRLYYQ